MSKERILVYGAGAIGTIFAGFILKKGYDVTLLARGGRLTELIAKGIILENALSGKQEKYKVKTISVLNENDIYDYIIVVVQNTQIDAILPELSKNKSGNIVFVVNNPLGYGEWIKMVGYERVMLGFPSAGGERKDGVVKYFVGRGIARAFQSTTFGELNGKNSARLMRLVKIFKESGFSPAVSNNMDAWQKTHVALVLPLGKALYKFNSNNYELAKSYGTIKKMVLATRECFEVLKAQNIKITPAKLNFYHLPLFIIVPFYMILFRTKIAEFAMAKHTIAARDEMEVLEKQFRQLIESSGIKTPIFDSF